MTDTPARDYKPGAQVEADGLTGTALAPTTGGAWFVAVDDDPRDVALVKRPTPKSPRARVIRRGDLNAPVRYAEAARNGYVTTKVREVGGRRTDGTRRTVTLRLLHVGACPAARDAMGNGAEVDNVAGATAYEAALLVLRGLAEGRWPTTTTASGVRVCECALGVAPDIIERRLGLAS